MHYEVRKGNQGWHVVDLTIYKAVAWVHSNRKADAQSLCDEFNTTVNYA